MDSTILKKLVLTCVLATATLTATSADTATAPADADAAWQKVESAIGALEHPSKAPPKDPAERMAFAKQLVSGFDDASQAFLDAFPNDARRWKIKLLQAKTVSAHKALGLPVKGDMKTLLQEIVQAPDVDKETAGSAQGILVLMARSEDDSHPEAWRKQAEDYLKAYPSGEFSAQIKSELDSMAVLAKLKTKPFELKFTAVDGREVDVAQLRGKVVLIDFWATWCGPCVRELPNVLAAYKKLHPKGFEIVGISLDQDKAKLTAFVKKHEMPWPQFFDGKGWQNEISSRFGIHSIPAMWLIDKNGMVVSTDARGELESKVEELLAQSETSDEAGSSN